MNGLANSVAFQRFNQDPDQAMRDWLQLLTPETMLGELPSFDVTVHPEVLTNVVDRELGLSPDVPWVIVADHGNLLGMISRPTLFAQLSRPFGQELYLKRPIRLLLESEHDEPLVLSSDMLVGEAALAAFQRVAERIYEPVVIRDGDRFRLLESQTLLIAQSRLLALANETIRSQADVAEAANQSKSLFLANMSHEIRTPLTAILGFAENILDPDCTAHERTTAVETILRNGHHLLQLINDILDLSKIEAGHLEVERLRFSPSEVVSDVISALQVRADAKQIALTLCYDGPIPDTIESDPTRLRQILMNLISNAIKFTEHGQVAVRLKMIDDQGRLVATNSPLPQTYLQCEVVDSGIGMNDKQLARLFSPFTQADESMARRFGGTGLGLSISRRLANLLGGDIVVTSALNVGSTFTARISAGPLVNSLWFDRPSSTGKLSSPVLRSTDIRLEGRILLAEDGPDNQLLIGSFLRKQGAEVTIVDNGRKAVDIALQSLAENRPFQVVLMDMQMPILDGYAATAELRKKGWARPIIALTANAMQGDRQKCLEVGCSDFAVKPINRTALIEQIHALIATQPVDSSKPQDDHDQLPKTGASLVAFDLPMALERVGGDPDLLREIAEMFSQMSSAWLDELQRHLIDRDASSARRIAHSLKSSADNIGGHEACIAVARLENTLAHGLVDEALSLWPECREHFLRLMNAVEDYLETEATSSDEKNTLSREKSLPTVTKS